MKNNNRIIKFNELLNINNCKDNINYFNIKDQILKFIDDNDGNIEYDEKKDIEKVTNIIFNKLNIDLKLIKKYDLTDEFNNLVKSLINVNNEIDKFIDINERSLLYKIYSNKIDDNIINNIIKYKEDLIYNYMYYIFSNIIYYSSKILYENCISNKLLSYYINYLIINIFFHITSGIYINIFSKIIFKYLINGYFNKYVVNYIYSYIEKYKLKYYLHDIIKYINNLYQQILNINILLENNIKNIFNSSIIEEYYKNINQYIYLLNNIFNKNNKTIDFSFTDYEIIQ